MFETNKFTAVGQWWLTDKPAADGFRGTLSFDASTAITFGVPTTVDDAHIPLVHGTTDHGDLTLVGCNLQSRSIFGEGDNRYRVESIIHGNVREPDYYANVPIARAPLPGLASSTDAPWSIEWSARTTAVLTIETERHLFTLAAPSLDAEISVDVDTPLTVHNSESVHVERTAWLTIKPTKPQPLTFFERAMGEIAAFSSLLTGRAVTVARFELGTENDFDDPDGPLTYARPTSQRSVDSPPSGSLYNELAKRGVLAPMLGRWLQSSEQHAIAVGHLFHCWNQSGPLLESRFMSAMQGLEVFHRRSPLRQTFIEPSDYESIRTSLVGSIPGGVDASLRSALKTRLNYGNELSLRRRLQDLVKSLPDPGILKTITDDATEWVQRVADLRNEHVHGTRAHGADDRRKMHRHLIGLSYLLHCLVLIDLGIPSDLLERVQMMEPYINFFLFPH